MQFVHARIEQDAEEYAYKVYMTDAAHNYPQGRYSKARWVDILNMKIDTRDGNEIVNDVMREAGLVFEQK